VASENWGQRVRDYLIEQEGFRADVYDDAGSPAIGYGHRIKPGEDFSKPLTKPEAEQLLVQDIIDHNRRARDEIGPDQFYALDQADRAKLLLAKWNPGSMPNFEQAVIEGDVDRQLEEYELFYEGQPMERRNQAFRQLFYGDEEERPVELAAAPEPTPAAPTPFTDTSAQPNPSIPTLVETEAFQAMNPLERVEAMAKADTRFAEMLRRDPERAGRFAEHMTQAGRGLQNFTPDVMSSLEGGAEQGIGWIAYAASGGVRLLEDYGLIEETNKDDDILDWANQRVAEGKKRIGTSFEHRAAGMVGLVATGAVPAVALTAATYPVVGAAGLTGVPAWMVAEATGLGVSGFLTTYGETEGDLEEAARRGAVDTALGAFGGATSALSRMARMPLDFGAGLTAGGLLGLDLEENLAQSLAMTMVAGLPGRRIPASKARMIADQIEVNQNGTLVLKEAERMETARNRIFQEMNEPLDTPVTSRDGVAYRTLGEYYQAEGLAAQETPIIHWAPTDRTPGQAAQWLDKDSFAQIDKRQLVVADGVTPDPAIPTGWAPGWRHPDLVPYGLTPERVLDAAGGNIQRPGEIIKDFAEAFEFQVQRGDIAATGDLPASVAGWHWGKAREMKVLRQDDLQTLAHEWGHDIVQVAPELSRYVQGKELANDVARLRNWLAQEEAAAGRVFNEQGVPSDTLYAHRANVPDDLKYIEELVALSYDRPNLREGFSEFIRAYLTNNTKWGGKTDMAAVAPKLNAALESWIESLPKRQKNALEKFATDSHAYVQQDATSSMLAKIGKDASTAMVMQSKLSQARQAMIDSNEGMWNAVNRAVDAQTADMAIAYAQSAQAAQRLGTLAAFDAVPYLKVDKDGFITQYAGNDGKSLMKIVQAIGPSREMQNGFGAYSTARRSMELFDQAIFPSGKRIRVTPWVDQYMERLYKRVAKKGDKATEQDLHLKRTWESDLPLWKKQDAVLNANGVGAQRREKLFAFDEIERNLALADNPRYAHFVKEFDNLKAWQRKVRKYAQDAGLLSEAKARDLDEWNSEYAFPFERDMSDVVGGAPSGGTSSREGNVIRELRGDRRPLADDWLVLTMRGADTLFKRAEDNLAKNFLIDQIINSPNGGVWFELNKFIGKSNTPLHSAPLSHVVGDVPLETGSRGHNITTFRNGKRHHYRTKDEGLFQSMEFLHPPAMGKIIDAGNKLRKVTQEFVTMNPEFFVPAFARDLVNSFIFSKTKGNFVAKAIRGLKESWINSQEYRDFIAAGSGGTLTDMPHATAAGLLAQAKRAEPSVKGLLYTPGALVNYLRKMTNVVEASTRFGEFQAAKNQGIPAKKAAWMGTQIQPHFSARGTNQMMKGYVQLSRFLAATINSTDRFVRGFVRDPDGRTKIIAKATGLGLAGVTLDELNRLMIPEWDNMPPWLKQAYHIFPIPEFDEEQGGFQFDENGYPKTEKYLMPKSHEVGLINNSISRVMDEMRSSKEKSTAAAALDVGMLMLGGIGVNALGDSFPIPMPVLAQEAVEVGFNHNLFTNSPIENMEMTGQSAWNRTDARTPELYRQWGRVAENAPWLPDFLESPTMAQHIIESITSTFGVQGAMLSEKLLNPHAMDMHIEDAPVWRRFRLRDDKYNEVTNQYWDTLKELSVLRADMSKWEAEGNIGAIERHLDDPEWSYDYARQEAYSQQRKILNEINSYMDFLRTTDTMDGAEKLREYDRMVKMQREVQAIVLHNWGPFQDE
jgi:hypothetical protein